MIRLLLIALLVVLLRVRIAAAQDVFDCGVRQITINELIVNGYNTVRGEWPWHVAIYIKDGSIEQYVCGGTLVSRQHILTTMHCVKNPRSGKPLMTDNIFVKLGVYRLNSTDGEIQRWKIRKIHRVDSLPGNKLRNDIAILELDAEAEFSKYLQPACLSLSRNLTGLVGTVIGWGLDENDHVSDVLKGAQLPVVDYNTCLTSNRALFGATLDEGLFCAGYTNGTAVCNGDSGGGIFFEENGVWFLGGITALAQFKRNRRCFIHGYAAFTKIHTYLAWIKSVTKLHLPIDEDQCEVKEFDPNVNYANLLPGDCGRNFANDTVEQGFTDVYEIPWMAILLIENQSPGFIKCEGSLIHKRYVLTTAYCTFYNLTGVRLGEHTIGNYRDCNDERCAPPVKDYEIECIIRHPIATKTMKPIGHGSAKVNIIEWMSNNIALIRLNADVIFIENIQPVCLPVTQPLRNLLVAEYSVTGWHFFPFGFSAHSLYKGTVKSDPDDCRTNMWNVDTNSLLCIDTISRQFICHLGLGIPIGQNVQYNGGERFVQFGIGDNHKHFYCDYAHALSIVTHMD